MNATRLGRFLFAGGMLGLGILSLKYDDFAMNWQPVPAGVPLRELLAYASGLLLLVTGIGIFIRRIAASSALVLTLFLFSWLLLLQFPRVFAEPGNVSFWLGIGETLELMTGCWILLTLLAGQENHSFIKIAASPRAAQIARILFALSLPLIGLSHFVYADFTAAMVPAWLPNRLGLAYLTGAGHIAAGIGLLVAILPRLAVTLEAVMMSSFVLLIHIPGVIAAPGDRLQWTMLCVAAAISGAAWTVAGSLGSTPWLGVPWNKRKS